MEGFDEFLNRLITAVWMVGTSAFIIFATCYKEVFFNFFSCVPLSQGGTWWRSGKGTTLQTGRSRVRFPMLSLEFFSDIILSVAL